MIRCTKCVTPLSHFSADDDGICPFCLSDDSIIRYKGEAKLVDLFRRHQELARRNSAKYDCLVPISGGKDSTYALYRLVETYGMRPLAFHYDNGFIDEQASRNLKKAVEHLGVDLVINEDHRLQERYLKHNLKALTSQPVNSLGRICSLLCVGCGAGYIDKADSLAAEHGISLIVQGGCPVEADLGYLNPDNPGASGKIAVIRLALREFREVITTPIFWNLRYPRNIHRHLRSNRVLLNYVMNRISRSSDALGSNVTREHYFQYCQWDENEIVTTLESNLGWQRPADRSSTTRFDCKLHLLIDACCSRYLGISDKEMTYSLMIRRNMIKRDEALRRLELEITEEKGMIRQTLADITFLLGYGEQGSNIVNDWCEILGISE